MRQFGLLLHISSLPSPFGIGDMGPAAHAFADILHETGAQAWQILPLNPTEPHLGNSPYASPSAFAGNPLFISPDLLLQDKYITLEELDAARPDMQNYARFTQGDTVDFPQAIAHRQKILHAAFDRAYPALEQNEAYRQFCAKEAHWIDDYARFVSIKRDHDGDPWIQWAHNFKHRDPNTLAGYDKVAARSLCKEKFIQFLFHSQWDALHQKCKSLGISLIGDVPLYVTHDSADVWAHPEQFYLDNNGESDVVAGVPPDYFSATGQRWGSPLYNWDQMLHTGFAWWKQRLERMLRQVDIVRLDHFRGFCGYWEIPAYEETAINGKWKSAPGYDFLRTMQYHFSGLPFIAEDLGIITDDVKAAMRDFTLPGMHVLQFAFGGKNPGENPDIPFAHSSRSVVYTGTHDNPPTRTWSKLLDEQERQTVSLYAGYPVTEENAAGALIRLAFGSAAELAVIPVQDVLNLGDGSRMNIPGTTNYNWKWRMVPGQMDSSLYLYLKKSAHAFGRLPKTEEPA